MLILGLIFLVVGLLDFIFFKHIGRYIYSFGSIQTKASSQQQLRRWFFYISIIEIVVGTVFVFLSLM